MQRSQWMIPGTLALILTSGPGHVGPARAEESPRMPEKPKGAAASPDILAPARSSRGGSLTTTARHQFEVFFYATGLRVFPRGQGGAAIDTSKLKGTATFALPDAPNPFVYPIRPSGPAPTSLDLAVDLGRIPASGSKVTFQVTGLPDPAEPTATFTVPFVPNGMANAPTAAAPKPRTKPEALSISRSTAADRAAIDAQRVCKVSGEPLGSMGVPIKVTRGDRSVFLCCQGCVRRIQANPDRYLGIASAVAR
jgi:hypothetical protein